MEKAIVDAWWEARGGGQSVAMMAPSNDNVLMLNQRAQQRRADAGEIDPAGPSVSGGGYRLVAGDLVATRQNDRRLRTDRDLMVKNRDQWEVVAVHRGGALTVSGATGTIRLPGDYVADHVELAYAQTGHANQGRTVDRSFLLLDGPADSRGIYVPMTRGRHSNEVFVVLEGEQSALDVLTHALARDWIDEPAVARRTELAARAPHGHGRDLASPLSATGLRELLERDHAISETLRMAELRVGIDGEQLARATNRHKELSEQLAQTQARQHEAQQVVDAFDHPLRRRLHRAELDEARVDLRQAGFTTDRMTTELAEIEGRLPALRSSLAEAQETLRERPALERERHGLRQRLGQDLEARKDSLAAAPPDYVVERLGPRPRSGSAVELWDTAAARIDQHRVAFDVADVDPTLGLPLPVWERSAFAASQREAANACDRLDRSLGRGREIEPPGLELEISL